MKKYIRTNNGRIYVSHDDLQIIDNTLCSMQNGRVWLVLGEVLKQSDNIPELCDRVVVKDFNNKEPRTYNPNKRNWKEIADTLFNERKVEWVKFAIWTDEGLIFVAEMNDKGDIVLL